MTIPAPEPLLVLRVRGTQAQMGAQLGEQLRGLPGADQTMQFYARMASAMLSLAAPHAVRGAARAALQAGMRVGTGMLHRARRRHFPAYVARTEALLRALGKPVALGRHMTVMDVLQNTVGLAGRHGLLHATGLQVAAIASCTSLAVWGSASSDGRLRHARNFDFPGAGVWDRGPTVVLCEPDEGLRYGFVTTRGADVPGVTAFNEAGLSLTAHTRFHRDVGFGGVGIIDFGHELVRRCRTLDDVRRVAGGLQTASTWGLLVSSASERRALVIETTGNAVAFVAPSPGACHLATTNRYLDPGLAVGEVTTSPSFVVDSNARCDRAHQAVRRHPGGMSRADLERLLGDTGDPGAPDPDADDRLTGNCITSAMTVKSVVFEPESARLRLSTGAAPTGLGPFIDVPWAWDGPVGPVEVQGHDEVPVGPGRSAAQQEAMRAYVAATRAHLDGASPRQVRALVEQAVEAAPTEPNLRFLAAIFAICTGEHSVARAHLRCALEREHGAYRRALLLLWHARVLVVDGEREAAEAAWRELEGLDEPEGVASLKAAAARDRQRPPSPWRLRATVPDVFMIDATLPGG
jgi:Acyl-coenzyme A:6-aminopenicillanic acid acyl-transferase